MTSSIGCPKLCEVAHGIHPDSFPQQEFVVWGSVGFMAFSEMMCSQWCDPSRLHDVLSGGVSPTVSTVRATETMCDEL